MTITFDSLTADELRVGDVLVDNDEVKQTITATAKSTSTGDVFIKVQGGEDTSPWAIVFGEDDPAPGYVRAAQWQNHLAELGQIEADEAQDAEPLQT